MLCLAKKLSPVAVTMSEWIHRHLYGWTLFSGVCSWRCLFLCLLVKTKCKSWCHYRRKSWTLACGIWRSCWLTLIAEVDLGSSSTCWNITWPDFMSMSTRGRIRCPMLWRIFWPSKVTPARSWDNSTWPVSPFNVSSVVMTSEETLGRLCFVKHESLSCAIVTIVSHFGCEMITCHISAYNTSQHG